ncbi:unnamed protein product [Parajaminaea phylloscopi]
MRPPYAAAAHPYDGGFPESSRGMDDSGRVHFDDRGNEVPRPVGRAELLQRVAPNASQDEPPAFFWTFDEDGKPQVSKLSLTASTADHEAPSAAASSSSSSSRRHPPPPPIGNRGFKLRPIGSLDDHTAAAAPLDSRRSRFDNSIAQDDELLTSHAPKWNAYGRLAPWTSGATGPLTGQAEEEVGSSGMVAGEEGEAGERRPRRGDRETNDRLRLRIAALQRAGVRSLLTSPPPRRDGSQDTAAAAAQDPGNDLRSHRRSSSPLLHASPSKRIKGLHRDEDSSTFLSTSALAPALLQPVLSPLDLLQSRTLRHTFRNPHIEALAKTTLDLGESEGEVIKSVGGFLAALEVDDSEGKYSVLTAATSLARAKEASEERERQRKRRRDAATDDNRADEEGLHSTNVLPNGQEQKRRRRRRRSRASFSPSILGSAGAAGTSWPNGSAADGVVQTPPTGPISLDELNPAFYKLDDLFVTREGLPIPVMPPDGAGMVEGEEVGPTDNDDERLPLAAGAPGAASEAQLNALHSTTDRPQQNGVGHIASEHKEEGANATAPNGPQGDGEQHDGAGPVTAGLEQRPQGPDEAMQDEQQQQILLPPHSQREILLASLSCLHNLAADSSEYLDRLNEVRGRLSEVRKKRDNLWRALRLWALDRLEQQYGSDSVDGSNEDARLDGDHEGRDVDAAEAASEKVGSTRGTASRTAGGKQSHTERARGVAISDAAAEPTSRRAA